MQHNQNGVRAQSGQVGLVVILIGAVLMTVGLGVASQSVLESKSARQETESSETFNAAEQSIEQMLQGGEVKVDGYTIKESSKEIQDDTYTGLILNGHTAQLNIANTTNLTLNWPEADSCMVVTLMSSNGSAMKRYAYGGCSGFTSACTTTPCNKATLTSEVSGMTIARIKAVNGDVTLTANIVSTGGNVQQTTYSSTAVKNNSNEARSIEAVQSEPAVPSVFDYALLSGIRIN